MSLTLAQQDATRAEFAENIKRSGITLAEIASGTGTTPEVIQQLIQLHPQRLEDPWIIRNYLLDYMAWHGQTPAPFTALKGDFHQYWFLNSKIIEKGIVG